MRGWSQYISEKFASEKEKTFQCSKYAPLNTSRSKPNLFCITYSQYSNIYFRNSPNEEESSQYSLITSNNSYFFFLLSRWPHFAPGMVFLLTHSFHSLINPPQSWLRVSFGPHSVCPHIYKTDSSSPWSIHCTDPRPCPACGGTWPAASARRTDPRGGMTCGGPPPRNPPASLPSRSEEHRDWKYPYHITKKRCVHYPSPLTKNFSVI